MTGRPPDVDSSLAGSADTVELQGGPKPPSGPPRQGPDYLALASTSVTPPEALGISATDPVENWGGDFEWSWRGAIAPAKRRWRRRARRLRSTDPARADYAKSRADSLAVDPLARADHCEENVMWIQCGCKRFAHRVGCGQRWVCDHCRRRHYSRVRRRLLSALEGHSRTAESGNSWVELRLSVRHSGDVAADRKRVVEAWRRLRSWLWKRIGARPFFLAHEVTPGRDELGHVHAHVLTLWPTVRRAGSMDWGAVSAQWRRATGDAGALIHIAKIRKGVKGAASYFAKYVSKGVQVGDFPPLLAGRVIAANYNQRLTSVSEGFWLGVCASHCCEACEEFYAVLSRPEPLRSRAPAVHWRGITDGIRAGPQQCFPPSLSKPPAPSPYSTSCGRDSTPNMVAPSPRRN